MLIIDRFEGNKAVLEYSDNEIKQIFDVPRTILPATADEGDIVEIKIDKSTAAKRGKKINSLADELFD